MSNITKTVVDDIKRLSDILAWWNESSSDYRDLILELEGLGYEVQLSSTGLDIRGSGGKSMLTAAFRAFRRFGFKPSSRPAKSESYFSCFFYHEELKQVWFSFSSTVCQRVKVRTEMREVDVYEIQCSEDMEVNEEEEI